MWVKVLLKIFGVFGVCSSIVSFGILILINTKYKEEFPEVFAAAGYNIAVSLYVLLLFIASIGIILLKSWGRILAIILLLIKIIESVIKLTNYMIYAIPQMKLIHLLEQSVSIGFFLLVIYFLSRKTTKNQFGHFSSRS